MSDLLLGQPLHHTQALELVCAAEKCDTWAEIRAGADGDICLFVDTPERRVAGWLLPTREDVNDFVGTTIGSLQMFGNYENVNWMEWGISRADWMAVHPDPIVERAFRGYMGHIMAWAKIVRCFKVAGERVLIAGQAWSDNGYFLGRSEIIQGNWAEQMSLSVENWADWQMEL